MAWRKPDPSEVWRAVDVYIALAYPDAAPGAAVRSRLEALRAASNGDFYHSPSLEPDPKESPRKFSLRLGNRFYPHMKLVIESSPDGIGHLFRADTHDRHIRPAPDSRDYAAFCKLMEDNQKLAETIEGAWERAGMPTFKQYLRQDLARRRAAVK